MARTLIADPAAWTRHLADGRRLAYAEYGDPGGQPVIYCHGLPGSRLEAAFAAKAARTHGIRLIAPDRPGVGGSDPDSDRTLARWAGDVAELADALALKRFAVLGVSGGAPYALACLAHIPRQLCFVGVAAGVGALEGAADLRRFRGLPRLAFTLAWRAAYGSSLHAHLFHGGCRILARLLRHRPQWALAFMRRSLDPVDVDVLGQTAVEKILTDSFREAARQGAASATRDLMLYVRSWDLAVLQKGVPVHFWHGQRDRVVPWQFSERQAARIPGANLTLFPEEGHYSLLLHRMEMMFETIRMAQAAGFGPRPVHA